MNDASDIDSRFAKRLLVWFDQFGRKSLPWQTSRDPYGVWVSEIMLQQTQVSAVIPYYQQFMVRFPDIEALAAADLDDVMQRWSGLGYYARARNLHRAAQQIVAEHGGQFPNTLEAANGLPGIGRSTAGAILSFCFGQRHPILDGNVKRVLTRYFAIAGFPGTKQVENRLWQLADKLTPEDRVEHYTQAIMDFGATLCTRTRPRCAACPQADGCRALAEGQPTVYPTRKPKKARTARSVTMLILVDPAQRVLLEKRPPSGIWGGLWSLPEFPDRQALEDSLGLVPTSEISALPACHHGFTHFDLEIRPVLVRVSEQNHQVMEGPKQQWVALSSITTVGLPAAITRLLDQVAGLHHGDADVII